MKYGAIAMPELMMRVSMVAVRFYAPFGTAFIRLRELAFSYKDLARKLWELEYKYSGHDKKIQEIFAALRGLANKPVSQNVKEIGFKYGR